MIQRIQTVYLFLAAVVIALVGFFPWAHCVVDAEGGGHFYTATALGVEANGVADSGITSVWCWLATLAALAGVVFSLWALVGFKNRVGQMRHCIYAILSLILFYVFFGVELWFMKESMDCSILFGLVGQCPLIAIILIFLAGRAIKRDEDLVRSTERIR